MKWLTDPPKSSSLNRGLAYAASLWAFLFAALSFYWGLGGRRGATTLGPAIMAAATDPLFVLVGLWGVGVVKAIGGVVALALVQPWGQRLPRRLLRAAAGIGGGLAFLYGAASWVQHALMLSGVVTLPAGLGRTAARWHLFLWDPWWMLGGALFVALAWLARRPV
jgi:hypothetical protein